MVNPGKPVNDLLFSVLSGFSGSIFLILSAPYVLKSLSILFSLIFSSGFLPLRLKTITLLRRVKKERAAEYTGVSELSLKILRGPVLRQY